MMHLQRPNKRLNNPFWNALGFTIQFVSNVVYRLVDRPFDPADVEITRHTLVLPRLHPAFHGYRVVQISDIHMGTWMTQARLEKIVDLVNSLTPDLIALTGDFVSYTVARPEQEIALPLKRLRPKDRAVAVLGNHDQWTNPEKVLAALEYAGVEELNNRSITLHRGEGCLHVAGVDGIFNEFDRLDLAMAGLPQEGAAILLAHEPDFAPKAAAAGRFDLQLSGHTHGGQINLPVFGPPLLPRWGRAYLRGLYQVEGMWLYVNRGVGTTSLPFRYRCPQEITVFELAAQGIPSSPSPVVLTG